MAPDRRKDGQTNGHVLEKKDMGSKHFWEQIFGAKNCLEGKIWKGPFEKENFF